MIKAVDGGLRTVEGMPSQWRPQPAQRGSCCHYSQRCEATSALSMHTITSSAHVGSVHVAITRWLAILQPSTGSWTVARLCIRYRRQVSTMLQTMAMSLWSWKAEGDYVQAAWTSAMNIQ